MDVNRDDELTWSEIDYYFQTPPEDIMNKFKDDPLELLVVIKRFVSLLLRGSITQYLNGINGKFGFNKTVVMFCEDVLGILNQTKKNDISTYVPLMNHGYGQDTINLGKIYTMSLCDEISVIVENEGILTLLYVVNGLIILKG